VTLGLLSKSVREAAMQTLLFAAALFVVEALVVYILSTFFRELAEQWNQVRFLQDILTALLGTELGGNLGPPAIAAMPWVHPIVLTLTWAHAILHTTRVPAGEIDRGTIDVLLGLPVARVQVFLCECAVGLLAGAILILAALAGNLLGTWLVGSGAAASAATVAQRVAAAANLYGLYMTVGGIAACLSAFSNRRGRAMGATFGVVVGLFLVNSLVPFWTWAERVGPCNPLHYYRPLLIFRDNALPLRDIAVLVTAGATLWAAGAWRFARRDICTV
jgi:ABC-type transport system involved in multi-copper enzyme maturation permease subunit